MDYKNLGQTLGIKIKTVEQKEEHWNKIIDSRNKHFAKMAEDNEKYKNAIGRLFRLEFEGGKCWQCDKQWEKKEFDNDFMRGEYYIPTCECFVKCPECKTHLYDIQFKFGDKLLYCDNCGFMLKNLATNSKRYGREFENFYSKLSREKQIEMMAERCTTSQ